MLRLQALALASFIASVSAHATFQAMWVNGVDQGSYCARTPASNSPVQSVTSNDIACNAGARSSANLCQVMPGDSVTVEMHQQPGDRSCSSEAIGGQHYGPVLVYMAKVTDAKSAVGSSSSWFKVSHLGMPSNNPDYFGTQVLNDNCGHYTFTVPKDIAPGNYLLRAEAIALHAAGSSGGAQFYMTCFQVNVGGSGSSNPPTVKLPGAYKASDPGILINIHQALATYVIPGPTAYGLPAPTIASTPYPAAPTWNTAQQPKTIPTAPAGAPPASTAAPPQTTAAPPASTAAPPSQTAGSPTSTAAAAIQTKYGQCGGVGYTGPTVCESGSTCKASSQYYSQCL